MSSDFKDQAEQVRDWVSRATAGLSSEQIVCFFEQSFALLWKRCRLTMSAVLLNAILNRVIFNCSENYFFLSKIKTDENEIIFDELHKHGTAISPEQLVAAFQLMMTDFLRILSSLTNDILTPGLVADLEKFKFEPKLKVLSRQSGEQK